MSTVKNRLTALRGQQGVEEERLLRCALEAAGWIQARAARALGCPPTSLHRAIRRHPGLVRAYGRQRGSRAGRPAQ